jgi:hypothetical protein
VSAWVGVAYRVHHGQTVREERRGGRLDGVDARLSFNPSNSTHQFVEVGVGELDHLAAGDARHDAQREARRRQNHREERLGGPHTWVCLVC